MIVADIIFALLVALIFGFAFYALFRRPGPWSSMWVFILVSFLVILAIGAWAAPLGAPVYNVHWIPFVMAGLLVMLLFAAIPPATAELEAPESSLESTGGEGARSTVG
jgi:hypothetical protein